MKLKHKISLLVIGILLVVSLLISSSYALWVFNVSQESTNVVVSDCFEITFTEGTQAINLTNSFPMKDGKGVYTTPYEFTLTNICEHAADISINLETLNDSQIAGENLRVDVNGHIHTYGDNNYVEPTLENASSAASFYNDTIAAGDSKSYNLRLWIKEDANNEDVLNKTLSSKITVKSTLRKNYSEATLTFGSGLNSILKSLSGSNSYYNTTITAIERSINAPGEEDNTSVISTNNSSTPVYAWFKDGTIYYYSAAEKIYLNSNAANSFSNFQNLTRLDLNGIDTSRTTTFYCLFSGLKSLESIDLSSFDSSNVTDMSNMFYQNNVLTNLDLSNFDTSNVTDMKFMFDQTSSLISLDLGTFNTSKVTDMTAMFEMNENLISLDLSSFDTSNVKKMFQMFSSAKKLELIDVSSFDTSSVIDMGFMFSECNTLKYLDLSNFDTSNVTDMSSMFSGTKLLEQLDLSNFDTSNVTDMGYMFSGMFNLNSLDLSNFDTSNVTRMVGMFKNDIVLKRLDLSSFNTSNVTDMSEMFYALSGMKDIDLSHFNTSKVTKMTYMFLGYEGKLNISSFDTSSVTNMKGMFNESNIDNLDLSNFNTRNVTTMEGMFSFSIYETLDLSAFEVNSLTNTSNMFLDMWDLKTVYVSNSWNNEGITSSSNMFGGSSYLTGGAGTVWNSNHLDATYARVDDPDNGKPGYFTLKTN